MYNHDIITITITSIFIPSTVVWEIFVVKHFRVTIFRELNFRFRGHPRKFIVHEDKMDEYGRALCVRGYHVILKSGRQLLDKLASLKNNELLAATP